MEASKIRFACANPEKSDKAKSVISDIIEEENNKLEFDKHKSNPVPHNVLVSNTYCFRKQHACVPKQHLRIMFVFNVLIYSSYKPILVSRYPIPNMRSYRLVFKTILHPFT